MITLPIISIVCCIAYIVFILFKYGVPVSISETYYLLPNKWDWVFAAWSVLTSVPFGIYWWSISPDNLKWIPITVMIALLLVGAACCYKSGPKKEDGYEPAIVQGDLPRLTRKFALSTIGQTWWQKILEYLKTKFNPKVFFKYPARVIHYVNSLIAIILSTIYICKTCGSTAIAGTIISYVVWIIIGTKVDGVYNPDYSLDVNNKAWIFFMEIICLTNLFRFNSP
jgi:hypothetical protein